MSKHVWVIIYYGLGFCCTMSTDCEEAANPRYITVWKTLKIELWENSVTSVSDNMFIMSNYCTVLGTHIKQVRCTTVLGTQIKEVYV